MQRIIGAAIEVHRHLGPGYLESIYHRALAVEFLERVAEGLRGARPMDLRDVTRAVFRTLARHVDAGQVGKVTEALPHEIRALWLDDA